MSRKPVVAICVPAPDFMCSGFALSLAWLCVHASPDFDVRVVHSKSSNIAIVRNNAVAAAKMHRADWLFFLDSDMVFPRTALHQLMAHGKDIVGATYPQRTDPFMMLGVASAGQDTTRQEGLIEMDYVPTGCLLINMAVFDGLDRPYFRCPFNEGGQITGEDVDFCERARDIGFTIYNDIDLSKEIGHIGSKVYMYDSPEVQKTMNDYKENQQKFNTAPISISVLIPSRGRPEMLKMTVNALDHLASEGNKITYCIAADVDDVATHLAANDLARKAGNVNVITMDRPAGIGRMYNELARLNPADAYLPFADDVLPLVQDWDVKIAQGVAQYPLLAWHDHFNGQFPSYPIISKAWYEAAGTIFPEYFPFWYNDTWINEIVTMVTGQRIPIATDMPLGGRRGKTTRLRDLGVWADFFRETRTERQDIAATIREKLQLPAPSVSKMSLEFEKYDLFMAANIDRFTAQFGDSSAPTPEYLDALEFAKARLENNRQRLSA